MRTLPQQVLVASITATALIAGEPRAAEPTTEGAANTVPACDVIAARVRDIVAEQAWTSIEQVTPDARFLDDLGFDSLDMLELIMAIEEEFDLEIRDEDAEKITTVGEATDYLRARLNCKR